MTRTILGIAALLAGAVALAGCGGSGSVNAGGASTGVAGAHHTKTVKGSGHASGNFRASVHGFEAQLQASVNKFQRGNVSGAAASGGSLLASCTNVVNGKLAPHASTHQQKQAVVHLRNACRDMSKAANAGMSGNLTKARAFARQALQQSKLAARLSG